MINDTWIRNYEIAKEYYLEHGDLNVPSKTKLYSWISAQKYAYRGKRGNISKEQISLLESIGIEWKSQRDKKWQWYYEHAKVTAPYLAPYQVVNSSLALLAMDVIDPKQEISQDLRIRAIKETKWQGRMETVLPEQSLAFIRIKSKTIWRNISFRRSAATRLVYAGQP